MLYLGLGTNIGNRLQNLTTAREMIAQQMGVIVSESIIYETAAWGLTDQDAFLNQVIVVKTKYTAKRILKTLLTIERAMGRIREVKWGPRIIDIDILYYADLQINTPDLVIPHPFIQDRRFVLVPLAEVAPRFIHPIILKSNSELLNECSDNADIQQFGQ